MNTRHVITDAARAQIVRLVRMGWTFRLVAQEIHVSPDSVSRICAEAGEHSPYDVRLRARAVEDRVMRLVMAESYARDVVRRRCGFTDNAAKYSLGVLDEALPAADGEEIRAIVAGTIKAVLP